MEDVEVELSSFTLQVSVCVANVDHLQVVVLVAEIGPRLIVLGDEPEGQGLGLDLDATRVLAHLGKVLKDVAQLRTHHRNARVLLGNELSPDDTVHGIRGTVVAHGAIVHHVAHLQVLLGLSCVS